MVKMTAIEVLRNVIAIEEMMESRRAQIPNVPYLELAKCIRVSGPAPARGAHLRAKSAKATAIRHADGSLWDMEVGH
jgi:hypothetical protein